MRKLLRYADCLVLLAAIVCCALRMWVDRHGLDGMGFYKTSHPAWLLLMLASVGAVVLFWFIGRDAGPDNRYRLNFPRSVAGGIGYLALGVVLGYSGIVSFLADSGLLSRLCALLSMLSAVTLATAGIERFSGNRPAFYLHMVPCIYLALKMFALGRDFSDDPQIPDFLFTFLASLALIPAFLWLWAFDIGTGKRNKSLFWSLTAAFLCLVAMFENNDGWLVHLAFAACLLTNLCALRYLPDPATNPSEAVKPTGTEEVPLEEFVPDLEDAPVREEAPVAEETPVEETPVAEAPEQNPNSPSEIADDNLDQLLADLHLYLDSEGVE